VLGEDAARAGDEEVAAWHAAAAAEGPDSEVAARLVALAARAGARGGQVSRARLLMRAADMVADIASRDALIADAVESAGIAGQMHLARELAAGVDLDATDPVTRCRLTMMWAIGAQYLADPASLTIAKDRLLSAADGLEGQWPELEQRALLLAFLIALSTQTNADLDSAARLGERMREGAARAPGPLAVSLNAASSLILDPYESAVPHLREAADALAALDDAELVVALPLVVVPTMGLWNADLALETFDRVIDAARRTGALREVDGAAWVASAVAVSCGDPNKAADYLAQAGNARQAVGYIDSLAVNAAQMAWAGVAVAAVEEVGAGMLAVGFGGIEKMARAGVACRHLADGEYESAYVILAGLLERPFVQASFYLYPDVVEAGVRAGHGNEVTTARDVLRVHAAASESPWARGMWAKSEALLADDDAAEDWYVMALSELSGTVARGQLARAHLVYGEWLRRRGRRSDAAVQLASAFTLLDEVGAAPFADRAQRELRACGANVPVSRRDSLADLTPQEAAVARLAARNKTNAEIGAVLFISPNTVDYHLRKVFRKLSITSRRQLVAALERSA
jgi:DNA-binding CsgD family transcriptional regulator